LSDLGTDGNILLRTLKAWLHKKIRPFLSSCKRDELIQQTRILCWPNGWYKITKKVLQSLQSEIPENNYQLKNEEHDNVMTLFWSYNNWETYSYIKTDVRSVITCKTISNPIQLCLFMALSSYPATFSSLWTVKYTEPSPEQIRQLL
jgi:hypothetical protein